MNTPQAMNSVMALTMRSCGTLRRVAACAPQLRRWRVKIMINRLRTWWRGEQIYPDPREIDIE